MTESLFENSSPITCDILGTWVVLLPNPWSARDFEENNPGLEVLALPAAAHRSPQSI